MEPTRIHASASLVHPLLWVALSLVPVSAQIDRNTNGFSDVWEAAFGGGNPGHADDDGDGLTNAEESQAGTNPHDASRYTRSSHITVVSDDKAHFQFPTEAGIHYQVEAATNLTAWQAFGPPVIGDGSNRTLEIDLRSSFVPGGLSGSVWTGLTGYGVSLIRGYVSNGVPLPSSTPSFSTLEYAQSSPNLEQFGVHMRGWLIPPASGSYTFWIASDDSSELWISSNALPSGRRVVASVSGWTGFREWTKYASQQSVPITLSSNQPCYIEVYHRESFGGDHLSVAWTRPDAAPGTREIIASPWLSPLGISLSDLAAGGNPLSLRVKARQADSDGDGLLDFEEHLLGLNPGATNSAPRQSDFAEAMRILDSDNSVTIGATAPRAYESNNGPGQFTVYRAGGIEPLTIHYTVSGSATPGADYQPLPGTIQLSVGQRTGLIPVAPLGDGLTETTETVTVTLQSATNYLIGSPASSTVSIDDAPDVLYVALLRGIPGISGGGSGLGALRQAGNALSATVNLGFNGLDSLQIAAEIVISSNGLGGTVVCSLPLDQVSLQPWNFSPTNGQTREAILDALAGGLAWMRIRTSGNPSGELIGQLVRSPGWHAMPVPPTPPPAPASPADAGDAARFLAQATFGPGINDMVSLSSNTFANWIDHQRSLPPTYHLPYVQFRRAELYARDGSDGWQTPRQMAWWQHALAAPDQLRQRMAWALSQILVVSQFGALDSEHEGITRYYDILLEHAFGNYRDLLEDVTRSPMMGTYLSMMRNQKPDPVTGHEPDENYAREIMQLFTIGLTEMHNDGSYRIDEEGMPIPTYSQEDIVGLAHIFTGWSAHYDWSNPPTWGEGGSVADPDDWFTWGWDPMEPMTFYGNRHDTLDRTIVGGNTIAASTNGIDRLAQALDILFNHPNVGPFIARQLIQRFVTSNPTPGYIHRVASVFNDNGSGVRGDLGATIKAVLLDYEARHIGPESSISSGKPIEPVMRLTRTLRAFPPAPPFATNGDYRLFMEFQWSLPEQVPQFASSVFNFYQPGYRHPGRIARSGLYSPEFQIFAETTAIREANLHYSMINWGIWTSEPLDTNDNVVLQVNVEPLVALLQTPGLTPAQAQALLIDHLDEVLLFGRMSTGLRGNLESFFASLPSWYNYSTSNQRQRARVALYLVLNSPEFLTQQ